MKYEGRKETKRREMGDGKRLRGQGGEEGERQTGI